MTLAVSWLATDVFEMHHDVFYLVYLTCAFGYLVYFARAGAPWREVLTRNLWWSLTIGVLVGFAVMRQIMSLTATPHPGGAFFVFEFVWRGLVYGAVDALVLAVFPAVVAYAVLRGNRRGLRRKAAFAGLVIAFSLLVSTAYHLGYSTYRGSELRKPLIGTVMWDLPAVLTGNPAGALIAHPVAHTTAVVHQYYGGEETNQMLPPELSGNYADHPEGTGALALSAGWIVVAGGGIVYVRRRQER
jgi:amino acid transporter